MKKILLILFVLLLCAVALAGCGEDALEKQTNALNEAAAAYDEAHSKNQAVQDSLNDLLATAENTTELITTTETITESPTTTEESAPIEQLPQYSVFRIDDTSIANAVRFSIEVVVMEEVSVVQLEKIAAKVVEDVKTETPFNAVSIGFYDFPEYVDHGNTLGSAIYAPGGIIRNADTVKAGEYNKMSFNFNLKEKNWAYRLNAEEVAIWKAWTDAFFDAATPENLPEDSIITALVAQQNNISAEYVSDIMKKQSLWTFNNIK